MKDFALVLLLWALARAAAAAPSEPAPAEEEEPEHTLPRAPRRNWSLDTMRLFVQQMRSIGLDPDLAFSAIGAASDFDPGSYLGDYVGLAMVRRDDLRAVGYPDGVEFYALKASDQIPWIARVVDARMKATRTEPKTVGDLAVLLHQPKAAMAALLRAGA